MGDFPPPPNIPPPGSIPHYQYPPPPGPGSSPFHGQAGHGGPQWEQPFQSGSSRARWTVGLQITQLVISVILVPMTIYVYTELARLSVLLKTSSTPSPEITQQLLAMAALSLLVSLVAVGVGVGSLVAFCMWLHRAYRNLPALGASELRTTPAWVVGSVFIPFANYVLPWLAILEIWKAGDPGLGRNTRESRMGVPLSPLVIVWWAATIAASVTGVVLQIVSRGFSTPAAMASSSSFFMVSTLAQLGIGLLVGVLTILSVRAIDARQEAKAALLGVAQPTHPPIS